MVRALVLRSGDPGFKTRSDHSLNLILVVPGSTFPAALVNSQLVCLRPVGIHNSCCCCSVPSFRCVSLALKSPYRERSMKYGCIFKTRSFSEKVESECWRGNWEQ